MPFKSGDPESLAANSRGGRAGSIEDKARAGAIGGKLGDRDAKAAGGAIGGLSRSARKLAACAQNAKKGGRPRDEAPSKMAEYKRKSREKLKSKKK